MRFGAPLTIEAVHILFCQNCAICSVFLFPPPVYAGAREACFIVTQLLALCCCCGASLTER